MLKRIAVTGCLASGKSTVCDVFQELGAYVVSADQIVHHLFSSSAVSQQVVELLGPQILHNELIDRKKIASLVFTNTTLLHKLERLMHPLVFEQIKNEYQKACRANYTLFVAEVPLLFETDFIPDFVSWFDTTIAIIAPIGARKERATSKQGLDATDFYKRSEQQLPCATKAARAHFVIENAGSVEELKTKTKQLYYQIHP